MKGLVVEMLKYAMKFCALLLMATLLLTVPTNGSSFGSELDGKSFAEAVRVVDALKIMDFGTDGDFNPDKIVSRSEFAHIACTLLGMETVSGGVTHSFPDVEADYIGAATIEIAVRTGIMDLYPDGGFGPDDPLRLEQAVKAFVVMLGYDFFALQRGGYPAGYFAIAAEKSILDGSDRRAGEPMPVGMLALMIYNVLEADVMRQTSYGDAVHYAIADGQTLLTENLKIQKRAGQVTATGSTTLIGKSMLNKNQVRIERSIYNKGQTNAEDFLGYHVVFYVDTTDDRGGMETILYIREDTGKNSTITVEADNIDDATTQDAFVYTDRAGNGRTITLNIKNAYVIYNGMAYTKYSDADFRPPDGNVRLIDSDNDGRYDVVAITSYDVYMVEAVSSISVQDRYGLPDLLLDREDASYEFKLIKDGEEIDIADINERDVLCAAISKSDNASTIKTIYVSDSRTEGTISEINAGDGTVDVDGTVYKLGTNYLRTLGTTEVRVGHRFVFHMDINGKIAGVSKLDGRNYAYLIGATIAPGISGMLQFKLLTASLGMQILNGADNFKLNGQPVRRPEDEDAIYDVATATIKQQLVTYELNAVGDVISINTAADCHNATFADGSANPDYTENYIGYTQDRFTLDFASPVLAFRGGGMQTLEATKYRISSNIKVFVIPSAESPQDDEYNVRGANYFRPDTNYLNLTLYDVNENYEVAAVVTLVGGNSSTTDTINNGALLTVVEKVNPALNSIGEETYVLHGVSAGVRVTVPASKADLRDQSGFWNPIFKDWRLSDLPLGAVIQYELDSRGEMVQMRVIYLPGQFATFTEKTDAGGATSTYVYGKLYVGYGKIFRKTPTSIIYNANGDGTQRAWDRNLMFATAKIYLCDFSKKTVQVVTATEIRNDDIVLVRRDWSNAVEIIIYRD